MSGPSLMRLGALASIWGASFLLIKLALEGMSPTQITLGRLGAGAVVLLAVAALRRQRLPRERDLLGHLTVLAVTANLTPFFLFGWAEQRISSGLAGVLNGATPLFTLGFAVLALAEERFTLARAGGLALGFTGVVLVVGPWRGAGASGGLPGQLAALGAAALYGVSIVYARRFVTGRGHSPLVLSAAQLSIATALGLLGAPFVATTPLALTPSVVVSIVALGAVGTGIAYLLYYRLIAEAGATNASMVTYLIPVVSVVLGAVFLGEAVGWNVYVGGAVVILGVALAEGRLVRRLRPKPEVSCPVPPAG